MMDSQDHKIPAVATGHEVHLCHRCGWPFPNPHPSARHRRTHKKVCGTIEGYKIIQSETEDHHLIVSDDDHSSDEDEHIPIVKVENRNEFGSGNIGGVGEKSNKDVFSDSGISPLLEERFDSVKEMQNTSKDHKTVEDETTDRTERLNDPTPIDQSPSVDSINEEGDRGMQQELMKKAKQDTDTQKEEKLISSVTLDPEEVEVKVSDFTSDEAESTEVLCDNLVSKLVSNDPSPLTETLEKLDATSEVKCVANSSESKHNGDIELNQDGNVVVLSENSESSTLEKQVLNQKCLIESTVIDNDNLDDGENVSVGSKSLQDKDEAKLTEAKDGVSATDLSGSVSRSDSLEVKCGSVSDKSETNLLEPKTTTKEEANFDKSDVFEAPSFMTLVQSSEIKTVQNKKTDAVKAAWFPSITNMVNESEGRKKNEEIISKVTNWNQAKQHIPMKNIPSDEAKSPKDNEPNKDQAASNEIEKEWDSPARYPIEIKKQKKKKRKVYWVPFVCCSSVHRDL